MFTPCYCKTKRRQITAIKSLGFDKNMASHESFLSVRVLYYESCKKHLFVFLNRISKGCNLLTFNCREAASNCQSSVTIDIHDVTNCTDDRDPA